MRIADLICRSDEPSVADLIGIAQGQPAFVMGGGPSLVDDYRNWVTDENRAVLITANDHGCRLSDQIGSRMPDYGVCLDDVELLFKPYPAVSVVGPKLWCDYVLFEKPLHYSGHNAVWIAWLMGCAPIVPLGMDLYQGGTYFDEPDARSGGTRITVKDHIDRWSRVPQAISWDDVVRVPVDSALHRAGIFPVYDPDELVVSKRADLERKNTVRIPQVQMLKEHRTKRGVRLVPGDVVNCSRPARGKLLRGNFAEVMSE